MSLVLQSSGGGSITIEEPITASNFTQTLPASTGTVVTTGTPQSGSVIQVVQGSTTTITTTTTNTYIDTTLSASITPKFATSTILVLVTMNGVGKTTSDTVVNLRLLRGASVISTFAVGTIGFTGSTASNFPGSSSVNIIDSPATISSTTYKVQFSSGNNTGVVSVQNANSVSTITLLEIAA
jgi:hypothetical protein